MFPEPVRDRVSFGEKGFIVRAGDQVVMRGDWVRVKEVFIFIRDMVLSDEICIGFRYEPDGTCWWVGERAVGYAELVAALPEKFPGIKTDWSREKSLGPAASNRVTLWGEAMK